MTQYISGILNWVCLFFGVYGLGYIIIKNEVPDFRLIWIVIIISQAIIFFLKGK